jgi:hypothetical protein
MGFADHYLSKQKGFRPFFPHAPAERLRFIVTIPAFCEPGLVATLQSLWNCERPRSGVEVIILVNAPEQASPSVVEMNHATLQEAAGWIAAHDDPSMRFLLMDQTRMPEQDAGVGLARKTAMDEALSRFNRLDKPDGVILSLDADSLCDNNYFTSIEEMLKKDPAVQGFSVYFEHPASGNDFALPVYQGIIAYELHLRYMNQFLRFAGFPHAYHTVGSCFGVTAAAYAAQGGMNKRKAGEDFYFLHKIIPLGHFVDVTATRVIPSPRASDRVPFGTGAAITKYLASGHLPLSTYSPESFLALRAFFAQTASFYKAEPESLSRLFLHLPDALRYYLSGLDAVQAIAEINANCSSASAFTNRFFRWFNAFRVIKFLNYAGRSYDPQIPVGEASVRYLTLAGYPNIPVQEDMLGLLMRFRQIERG